MPHCRLFKDLLSVVARTVKEGVWPYPKYLAVTADYYTKAVSFTPRMTEALINVFHR
jgi:hypothetical protein